MMNKKVSVVIPTFKRNETLGRAIQSVLIQGDIIGEIFVIDDNTDVSIQRGARELTDGFSSPLIKYILNNGQHGGSAARNVGIDAAAYEFIAFLDDDDLWLPGKIVRQIAAIESDGTVGCFCGYFEEDLIFSENTAIFPEKNIAVLRDFVEGNCPTSTSLAVVKTDILRRLKGFNPDIPSFEDYDLWLRSATQGDFSIVPDCLVVYIQHRGERLSVDFDKRLRGYQALRDLWSNNQRVSQLLSESFSYHATTSCIANAKSRLGISYWQSISWSWRAIIFSPGSLRAWQWIFMSLMGYRLTKVIRYNLRALLGRNAVQTPVSQKIDKNWQS